MQINPLLMLLTKNWRKRNSIMKKISFTLACMLIFAAFFSGYAIAIEKKLEVKPEKLFEALEGHWTIDARGVSKGNQFQRVGIVAFTRTSDTSVIGQSAIHGALPVGKNYKTMEGYVAKGIEFRNSKIKLWWDENKKKVVRGEVHEDGSLTDLHYWDLFDLGFQGSQLWPEGIPPFGITEKPVKHPERFVIFNNDTMTWSGYVIDLRGNVLMEVSTIMRKMDMNR
jgi:hypothetical protein